MSEIDKYEITCSAEEIQSIVLQIKDTLDVLHGRWRLPILISLAFGKKRFSQISKDVIGISDKILSKELRDLEMNQLIIRSIYDTFPPTVEYSISEHGASLKNVAIVLRNWGMEHRKKIMGKS